jgi:UDP-glucose 4-epimerase
MNILITGGMGFVGYHLSKYLVKTGHRVTIYDNLSNSKKVLNTKIQFIEGDILNYSLLSSSLENIELVIHLAAQISVSDSITNPDNTLKINVNGTENVLNACKANKINNFISISTAAVFGNQHILLSEKSKLLPISPYGESKFLMEEKIISFSKKYNLNSIILRFFNLYGPGQSPQYAGVITKFLKNISTLSPIEIHGDGNQSRDFLHIDDAIICIDLAIQKLDGKLGRVYNVGTGKSTSILQLANLLLELCERDVPIIFKPAIKGDILKSETSIEQVKKELNFNPKIPLKDGLSQFIKSDF